MRKIYLLVLAFSLLSFTALMVGAQDIQTKGSIKGTVTDQNGAVLGGATVTVTGASGVHTATSNSDGTYEVANLTPGVYSVKITQTGFKSVESPNTTVYVGKATVVDSKMEIGAATAVVEVTATNTIDQASTAAGANMNDQLFQNIPVARSVSGLFYLAPGTTDGLGGGKDNPSISGGSALDNLYVADGVNITNSAFGGIGTFSRSYGALGTGINTSFVKEVQVKTGGFEPQYGQSTGGIVNIITQSGGNDFHGAVYGYMKPNAFEGAYKQPDDLRVNKGGEVLANESYDAGVDVGGRIVKDKLFFFGSFNPTINRTLVQGASNSQLFTLLGVHDRRFRTLNYSGKIDYNIAKSHTLSFSMFGDPTDTNKSSFATLATDNTTAQSQLSYGSQNLSVRYNGALTNTWTISASYGMTHNKFDEFGFDNFNQIGDSTGPQAGGSRGTFTAIGRGFIEPTHSANHTFTFDTNKTASLWGQHSLGVGYTFQRGFYSGNRDRSGPHFLIPGFNATGQSIDSIATVPSGGRSTAGQTVNAQFSLRVASNAAGGGSCSLCPVWNIPGASDIGLGPGNRRVYLLQTRGEYGNPVFDTSSDYQAAYAQDTWRFNRFVTGLAGIRWEQEQVTGAPAASGKRNTYAFTGQWAPRFGITVDPLGKGKMKVYYNWGRFYEFLPLDLAERSLSAEQDFTGARLAPVSTPCVVGGVSTICAVRNSFNTVNVAYDQAHLLNSASGPLCPGGISPCGTGTGITVSANDPSNPIYPGTQLGFLEEQTVGFETQLPKLFTLSVRYNYRNMKRIVEDASVVSPEAANAGLFGQAYFLANVSSKFDGAINPIPHVFTAGGPVPSVCNLSLGVINPVTDPHTGATLGAICYSGPNNAGDVGSDGIPDGFPDPVHKYHGVEIEMNRRFANNWQIIANWRIASLKGNYEGHLRNDNGQTDPGISSLFDFTQGEFNLLGDQFASGPLNTDRRHVINIAGSYSFTKSGWGHTLNGLNLGFRFASASGLPISEFLAHPVYLNAGEIPVGGRGKLGRTPWNNRIDAHVDYPWNLSERQRIKFVADFFNITNTRKVFLVDQNRESSLNVNNVDFLTPTQYYAPFNMRLGVRWEF